MKWLQNISQFLSFQEIVQHLRIEWSLHPLFPFGQLKSSHLIKCRTCPEVLLKLTKTVDGSCLLQEFQLNVYILQIWNLCLRGVRFSEFRELLLTCENIIRFSVELFLKIVIEIKMVSFVGFFFFCHQGVKLGFLNMLGIIFVQVTANN